MAFDYAQLFTLQSALGVVLFAFTAWRAGEALAGKKSDVVTKAALGLAAALLIPGTLLLLLNLVLHVPISTPIVYVAFVLVALVSKAKTDGHFTRLGLKP